MDLFVMGMPHARGPTVSAVAADGSALRFWAPNTRQVRWVGVRGEPVAAPDAWREVPTAWRSGLYGFDPPRSRYPKATPDGHRLRSQRAGGGGAFVELSDRFERRQLYEIRRARVRHRRRDLGDDVRVEAIGDGKAILLDPTAHTLEVLTFGGGTLRAPLPPRLRRLVEGWAGAHLPKRRMTFVPEADVLVLGGGAIAVWLPAAPLRALSAAATLTLSPRPVRPEPAPDAEPGLEVAGEVTLSGYGRTVIRTERGTTHVFVEGFEKGERVVLRGLLGVRDGMPAFASLVRADRRVVSLVREPPPLEEEALDFEAAREPDAPPRTSPLSAAEEAQLATLRAVGLFGALDDAFLRGWSHRMADLADAVDLFAIEGSRGDAVFLRSPISVRAAQELDLPLVEEGDAARLEGSAEVFPCRTHHGVVTAINAGLAAKGDARRFVPLRARDPEEPLYVLARPEQVEALRGAGLLDAFAGAFD